MKYILHLTLLSACFFSLSSTRAMPLESQTALTVNAADWKPAPEDATDALQNSIDSGAQIVRVPNIGSPWIVRPIRLRSNLEIIFEDGVEIRAKTGEFHKKHDSLFLAENVQNLKIRGQGKVTLRMNKRHYQMAEYVPSEWRHGISLRACQNVLIENLTIRETGGDGIYLGLMNKTDACKDVTIRNIVSDSNHRQGLSVIAGQNILIEDSVFCNTQGTKPEAGLDIEPSQDGHNVENIIVRRCLSENNVGAGFIVYLRDLTKEKSQPVSILFDRCKVSNNNGPAFTVGAVTSRAPGGEVRFKDCLAENVNSPGIYVYDKDRNGVRVIFENCTLRKVATKPDLMQLSPEDVSRELLTAFPVAPIVLYLRRPTFTTTPGGVEFLDCLVDDDPARPVLAAGTSGVTHHPVQDVNGVIYTTHSAPQMNLGPNAPPIALELLQVTK